MFDKSLVLAIAVAVGSALGGCTAPTGEGDAVGAQNALRNGIDVTFVDYDTRRERFILEIEVDAVVLRDPDARYLVAQLSYRSRYGEESPFSATAVDETRFEDIGDDRLRTELYVDGPNPLDLESVVATVSSNPTPHP